MPTITLETWAEWSGKRHPNGVFVKALREAKLLNADGSAVLPAVGIPTLPTADGDYTLRVASGVYSWVLEGT